MLVARARPGPLVAVARRDRGGRDREVDGARLRGPIERHFARRLFEATVDRRQPEMVNGEVGKRMIRIKRIGFRRRDGCDRQDREQQDGEALRHRILLRLERQLNEPRAAYHAAAMGQMAATSEQNARSAARAINGNRLLVGSIAASGTSNSSGSAYQGSWASIRLPAANRLVRIAIDNAPVNRAAMSREKITCTRSNAPAAAATAMPARRKPIDAERTAAAPVARPRPSPAAPVRNPSSRNPSTSAVSTKPKTAMPAAAT